ncbi:flavin reductase family protein [Candidatus Aerophobetes bacterium]|nr:flavin reductase family protein [Candidatus Aerophobetes bacterium]
MRKVKVNYTDYLKETLQAMSNTGLLLTSADKRGKMNVMTIGWGTVGIIWGMPMFLVLVRPSRFTYGLIEETGEFTVNVPPRRLSEITFFCGSVSGRDHDKFKEKGLTPIAGENVISPIIEECVVHYECKVLHKNDIIPARVPEEAISKFYPQGDYHRIFFGRIISVFANREVKID